MAFPRNKHQGIPTPSPLQQPLPIPHPLEQHHHRIHLIMIIMACMVSMLIFLCTISLIRKRLRSTANNRNRNGNGTESPILFDVNSNGADEEEEMTVTHPIWFIRTVGLQQTFIESITVFQYGKEDGLIDGTECSVCLGEFEQGESLRLLPKCSHAFHIPCIDTWLSSHKNCPLCRAPVARDEVAPVRPLDQNISNDLTGENVSHHDHQRQENYTNEASGWSDRVETQLLRRSVSVDSSSSSTMFGGDVVVDLRCDGESSESGACNIGKEDMRMQSSMSSSNCKKKSVSMRRSSFSNSSNFFFSKHSRSLSSTLPL